MKYVLMNLPVEKVAEATALLPGMRSPTILPLAQEGWCSLHAVIGKAQLWSASNGSKPSAPKAFWCWRSKT